ncbi:MAG: GNAT family N-acetyltransferase [Acidimicrobiales bacterium]
MRKADWPTVPATIEIATEVTPELADCCRRLIPQLSSKPPPSSAELSEMVESPATTMFVARGEDGSLVGTLTLCTFRIPTGVRSWIEDVVVDERHRGQGVADALTQAAIAEARRRGARTVDLTSRPGREAANRFYQRLGFTQRDTNVYRLALDQT